MRYLLLGATLTLNLNVVTVMAQQQQVVPVGVGPAVTEAMRERATISRGDPARLYSVPIDENDRLVFTLGSGRYAFHVLAVRAPFAGK